MEVFYIKTTQIHGDFASHKLDGNQSFGYLYNTSRAY